MATTKSKANPYKWPNGTYHSRPYGAGHRDDKPAAKKEGPGKTLVTLTHAPKGTYDPLIDIEAGATKRGLSDLLEDYDPTTGQYSQRALEDLNLSTEDINRRKAQTQEDYTSNVGDVNRSYEQLGGQQGEAINAAGLMGGGAALQAAQKRQANKQLSLDDMLRQNQRAMDPKSGTFALEAGQAGQNYTRSLQDYTSQLTRGQREATVKAGEYENARWQGYLSTPGTSRKKWVTPAQRAKLRKQKVI